MKSTMYRVLPGLTAIALSDSHNLKIFMHQ